MKTLKLTIKSISMHLLSKKSAETHYSIVIDIEKL